MPLKVEELSVMSHHYSGPNFGFPSGDARLDLTDIYAFRSPLRGDASVLVLNAHPSTSLTTLEPTTTDPFAPDAVYELKIDTDGDAVADIAYRVLVSGTQEFGTKATVRRAEGISAAGTSNEGEILFRNAPISTGHKAWIAESQGYRFFAGWRSDPFFFDTLGAVNGLKFTGHDFFIDKDVCSIVLEIPNSRLGTRPLSLWGCVSQKVDESWVQIERGARPQQAVFLPGDQQEAYLAAGPANDSQFISALAHSLEHAGGYSAVEAEKVARSLLPDVMLYDPARPAVFPTNGRSLTDDAADVFLSILTNGKIIRDGVGPHEDITLEFPHLGPPHRT
ncbi:DUF4331 family protein [Rhizobium leguminosarum]|uniref:DUF4331 family protein n=1 Tax=Rhizobium leguminosarum TaxID=384 RepID=UPI000684CBF7